ncbi:hypothetical protein TRFO_24928 [Tritrichomonas foetus]|uniref:FPL domain-containing protein n=1 Tax=Tritrichomonas foetus TaxID=1144522 RepID=A0A1J4KBW5_9EUKA|nr:hypothetical protein TRFO_24928 [Tritrichomonas foetus]|eukprot:OHT06957.1 hypothetical protein TRFO_24928 [Tritrichomonas foetus]
MSSLPKLISLLANKVGDLLVPPTAESVQQKIKSIWVELLKIFSHYSNRHFDLMHESLESLIEELETAESHNLINVAINEVGKLNLMPHLVIFTKTHRNKKVINEVLTFFCECSKFTPFLKKLFFIKSLNGLLVKYEPPNNDLIKNIVSYLLLKPKYIHLYLEKTSSPFLTRTFFTFSENYSVCGELILNLVNQSKTNECLLEIISSSVFINPLVTFVIDCLSTYTIDRGKQSFLDYINRSVSFGPFDYIYSITRAFDSDIITPFVIEEDPIPSLRNSIYLLTSFECEYLMKPPLEFLEGALVDYLSESDEQILILTIRCSTLLFESTDPYLGDIPNSYNTVDDFMGFTKPEWHVKSDIIDIYNSAISHISVSLSSSIVNRNKCKWDAEYLFKELLNKLSKFVMNSFTINLALQEFFVSFAANWSSSSNFHALSKDCENGLVNTLIEVCGIMEKRIGMRPETIQNITENYELLENMERGASVTEEQKKYINLIILLEFLKELHAISQAKGFLNQHAM